MKFATVSGTAPWSSSRTNEPWLVSKVARGRSDSSALAEGAAVERLPKASAAMVEVICRTVRSNKVRLLVPWRMAGQ